MGDDEDFRNWSHHQMWHKKEYICNQEKNFCVCVYFNVVTVLYIIVSPCFYFEERVTEIEGSNKRWT